MAPTPWYASKTVWLNIAAILIVILTALSGRQDLISSDVIEVFGLVLAILNIIIRFFTKTPIATMKGRNNEH